MDRLFDRLGDFVRSIIGEGSRPSSTTARNSDPEMQEAWEELEAYLRDEPRPGRPRPRAEQSAHLREREHLRQDYANLEVAFGAPMDEVRKAYRKLLIRYHPDRNASDPERLRMATEITQKINVSFQKIREFERAHSGSRG